MDADQMSQLTPKAQHTRQHILAVALHLFAAQGYEGTTMRDIASEAGCSLGLTYRYYRSKEDLVLELYRWLVDQLGDLVSSLPATSLADRFDRLMRELLEVMTPHRLTLSALFGISLNPRSQAGLFSADGTAIRRRARAAYVTVVGGAKDAPRPAQREEFATLLYGIQLAIVVFWLQDLSAETSKTMELLALIHELLERSRLILRLPWASSLLMRIVQIIGPLLGYDDLSNLAK